MEKLKACYLSAIGCALLMQGELASAQTATEKPRHTVVRPKMASKCRKPEWPRYSPTVGDDGALHILARIAADGKVTPVSTLLSSGFPELDEASAESLKRCRFTPGTVDGKPVPMLIGVYYLWVETSTGIYGPNWQNILQAAKNGELSAINSVAQLQLGQPSTSLTGMELLKMIAEKGYPMAQHDLAQRYEFGDGVEKDLDLADKWYARAVAQGDIMAIERERLIQEAMSETP